MNTVPFPTEKFLEDYVVKKMEEERRCPIAEDRFDFFLRQYEIKGYGITDIIKIEVDPGAIIVTILELKNEPLKESHLSQLARYIRGAERAAEVYRRFLPAGWDIEVRGQLAGPLDLSLNDLIFMADMIEDKVSLWGLSLDLDSGFNVKEVGSGWYKKGEDLSCHKGVARRSFALMKSLEKDMKTLCGNVASLEAK